jgi:hypothetical protein
MGTTVISGSARMRVVKTGTGTGTAIADSLRDRYAPFRPAYHASYHLAGTVRAHGERARAQAVAGILSLCCGACCGTDAGTAADGGVGHFIAGRTAHGEETGDRQTLNLHHGPGIDGCPLYGQDRYAALGGCRPVGGLSAVDVAKEAADMILRDQDLHVLHDSVLEGRRTFGNIMKYILM